MKIIAFLLALLLALTGCNTPNSPSETPSEPPVEPAISQMDMTIAQLQPSGIPIESGHCFYAHDESDNFYRVLWEQTDELVPEAKVLVDYHSKTKLEYPDGYPDGGYTPQYEITAVAVTVLEISDPSTVRSVADDFLTRRCDVTDLSGFVISTMTDERGKSFVEYGVSGGFYLVAVSAEGTVEYVFDGMDEYAHYLPLATPQAIRQADELISAQAPSGSYYFSVDDEGYLCLNAEVIVQLELVPPADENGLVMSGCGIDHEHLFFSERICPKP